MSKIVAYCALLCVVSLIAVNGLPTRKEDENDSAAIQNGTYANFFDKIIK